MANNDQNDKEINDYLDGDSGVSKAYRASNQTEPSSQLDDAILSAAKETVNVSNNNARQKVKPKFHKSPWVKPVSIAAMITLSVSLVVTMQQQESGQPLISEPEVEIFDSAPLIKESELSRTITSSDGVSIKNNTDIKKNEGERVDMAEPMSATLGAAADIYLAEEKPEAPKAIVRKRSEKSMLLKEKIQTEAVEKRVFYDEQVMQSASTVIEFDNVINEKQDREFNMQKDVLLKIKVLWERSELVAAKQAYQDFNDNYPDFNVETVKKIIGTNIYSELLDFDSNNVP